MAEKSICLETLKNDFEGNDRPISAPTMSKEAYKMGKQYSLQKCRKRIKFDCQTSDYFSVM